MSKPRRSKEFAIDYEIVSEVFEDVAAKRMTPEFTAYLEGVADALGWVLGEYDDKPTD